MLSIRMIPALLLTMAAVIMPQSAFGQVHLGLRGGITNNPDQIHIGLHNRGMIAPLWRFQPNADVGFGNNLTIISLNPDFHFLLPSQRTVRPYIGGAPGVFIIDRNTPVAGGTQTEIGLNILVGLDIASSTYRAAFVEFKIGVGDIPEMKLTGGISF